VGPQVNLGNVALSDVIGVETLRLGLRADTLLQMAPSPDMRMWSSIGAEHAADQMRLAG
jgi:hypothetical protein